MVQGPVATEDLGPIAGPRGLATAEVGERDLIPELRTPRVAGEQRPGPGVDLGDHERRGRAAEGAEHPLDVRSHRQAAPAAGAVLAGQPRELDRILAPHELEGTRRAAVGGVLETA